MYIWRNLINIFLFTFLSYCFFPICTAIKGLAWLRVGGELGEGGMSQQNKIPPRFGQKSIVSRMIDLRDKGEKRWCTMTVWSGLIPSAIKTHLHHTSRSRTSHVMMQGQNCMIYCGLMGILRHILLPKTSFEISIDTYRLINTGMLVERGRWHKKKEPYIHMSCIVISHFKNIFGNCDFNTKQKSAKKKKKKRRKGTRKFLFFFFEETSTSQIVFYRLLYNTTKYK